MTTSPDYFQLCLRILALFYHIGREVVEFRMILTVGAVYDCPSFVLIAEILKWRNSE
jgi:hypothetical protein